MTRQLDPFIARALAARAEAVAAAGGMVSPHRDDPIALRRFLDPGFLPSHAQAGPAPDVSYSEYSAVSTDGTVIPLRLYRKAGSEPGSAVVYLHGGGLISGSVALYDHLLRAYVQWTGVPFLAVDNRLAPEATGTAITEDAFAGVEWLREHAAEQAIDPTRIAVMGDSGGGAPAAGAAILARDRGIRLRGQILIYPMLDDRNTDPDPELEPTAVWSYDNNYTGWHALLGDRIGADDVSPLAAPARNRDFRGLAPAYIETGDLDIFRDEDLDYAGRLVRAGVSTELHMYPGAPHGYDWIGYGGPLTKRWRADRIRVIRAL
ncbi:alpha/beta hydrolase [Microbacterium sp. RD1]|uniref:alpha/beta hydrolase n=1 Tax=Microbacterium sp. RD1 TaxID=3457313 RepID=UPI003FA54DA1